MCIYSWYCKSARLSPLQLPRQLLGEITKKLKAEEAASLTAKRKKALADAGLDDDDTPVKQPKAKARRKKAWPCTSLESNFLL